MCKELGLSHIHLFETISQVEYSEKISGKTLCSVLAHVSRICMHMPVSYRNFWKGTQEISHMIAPKERRWVTGRHTEKFTFTTYHFVFPYLCTKCILFKKFKTKSSLCIDSI